jgi:CDP-diacylglycerol--glycerol-3-phosphate 3-phosphatidyltransferase
MTFANQITLVRIGMIPAFVLAALYYGRGLKVGLPDERLRLLAIGLFAVAALSDGLDGWVARRFNQKSDLGIILDPIADKGLLLAGIVTLSLSSWSYELPLWFPILVISRDIIVGVGATLISLLSGEIEIVPTWSGKVGTAIQMVALSTAMLQPEWVLRPRWDFGALGVWCWQDGIVWAAALFTGISGLGYSLWGIGRLHRLGHGEGRGFDEPPRPGTRFSGEVRRRTTWW